MGFLNYLRNPELFPRNLEGRARTKNPENKKKMQRTASIGKFKRGEKKKVNERDRDNLVSISEPQ